ncbi:MAG: methylated-DNA--[protein]-cysteine S-methyltransferase [Chloroflexota bacterium]|nr:methylated-DNA--[protein]-cysteine S-methyltransferase [Chloroflexota bacterium]
MKFYLCDTDLGWIGLVFSPRGLRATTLPLQDGGDALREVLALGGQEEAREEELGYACLGDLPHLLRRYAGGEPVAFPDSLDLAGVTPFQRDVWLATRDIPYGETRSYGWLAAQVGRPGAARAVGQAMATNPWPIIVPCHRVVGADGGLGGYGGGLGMKEHLLRLEGAL